MSPPALEHFNHSDFLYLAELMTEFEREMGRLPASFDQIEAFAQSEGYSLKCTASDLTLREKVSTPTIAFATPLGKVVILGVEKDDFGLVWAVTEAGIVIKVDPDELIQQPQLHQKNARKEISAISPSITNKGTLHWHCDFAGRTWVDVKAYLFAPSTGLETAFEEQRASREENLRRCWKMAEQAPTEELRRTYKDEIRLYEKDLFRFAGSWENWPIVVIVPVFEEGSAPTKALVICRYQARPVDISFTMFCPHQITHADLLRIARELSWHFEALNEKGWTELPIKNEPVCNPDGDIAASEIIDFAQTSVFIKQR
jgi:hypothetical protein